MSSNHVIACGALLLPVTVMITYMDVRYRRIPNAYVLATLAGGLLINTLLNGLPGLLASLEGCGLAFLCMLALHIFGAMGAGDVKLFGAIGAVIGFDLVLPTFVTVLLTGFVMALFLMFRAGIARPTMVGVLRIFMGFLPGWEMPRLTAPADRRHTIPYGVAITFGSLISLAIFRA